MGNNDSRTIFREHIQFLVNEDITDDTNFWSSLFSLECTIDDINLMVSKEDILRLYTEYRPNFLKLIDLSLQNLEESYNQVLSLDAQQLNFTSTSVKILMRLIPISYEFPEAEHVWWESQRGYRLLKCALGLLHTQVYSVYASLGINKNEGVAVALLWREGLLTELPVTEVSEVIWMRRYELLLLIKAIISDISPRFIASKSAFLAVNEHWILQLIFSLINTLVTFNPFGLWSLPYTSYAKSPSKEKSLKVGLQIICILNLCSAKSISSTGINRIKTLLSTIKDRRDLLILWKGIKDLLSSIYVSTNTYLPNSQKPFDLTDELLLFLFTLLRENADFLHIVASQPDLVDLLVPILHILLQSPPRFICLLCAYILIKLSESRKFCVSLNQPITSSPLDLPLFTGNYGDLIIISFSKLIFSKSATIEAMSNLLLTCISNFSPYLKSLSHVSSNNLIRLLQDASLSSWANGESEIESVALLLEIISNLIQYQWRGCSNLVYWVSQNSVMLYKINRSSVLRIKEFSEVLMVVAHGMKELKDIQQAQFVELCKRCTLVGLLPQPHAIVTRKINFEESRLLESVFQHFYKETRAGEIDNKWSMR